MSSLPAIIARIAQAHRAGIVTPTDPYFTNVVSLIPFLGASNSPEFYDVAGSQWTPFGNASLSTAQKKFGSASLALDGAGDYLAFAEDTRFNLESAAAFTVEAFIYRAVSGVGHYIFSKRPNSTAQQGWEFRVNADNTLQFFFTGGTSLISTATIPSGQWVHVAATRSNGTLYLFINGVLDKSAATTGGTPYSGSIRIGEASDSSLPFNGYIDEVRITNGVARYTANFTPPAAAFGDTYAADPYLAYVVTLLHMDGANGSTTIKDSIRRNWKPGGNAKLSDAHSRFFGVAGSFDASANTWIAYDDASLNLGTGDFTIEGFVYLNSLGKKHTVIAQQANGFSLGVNSSNKLEFAQAFVAVRATGSTQLAAGQWYHIAASRSGGYLQLYLNGALEALVSNADNFNSTETGIGGYRGVLASDQFSGYLSELRITKGVDRYPASFSAPSVAFPDSAAADANFSSVVSLLHLDGANGSTALTDQTGKVWTCAGSAALSNTSPKFGSASLLLNGSTDYATTPDSADFSMGSGNFTVECWCNPSAIDGIRPILGQFNASTYAPFRLEINSGNYNFLISGSGGSWDGGTVTLTAPATVGKWDHIALVRCGSTFALYLNGVLKGVRTYSGALYDSADAMRLGNLTTNFFAGKIDDVRITKGVARYSSLAAPATNYYDGLDADDYFGNVASLIHFDGADGATSIYDRSGKAWTAAGNAQLDTASCKFGSASLLCDGNGDFFQTPSAADFDFGSGDFTVEAWVRADGVLGSYAAIVGKHLTNGAYSGNIAWLFGANAGKLSISVYSGGTTYTVTDSAAFPTGQPDYIHVAAVRSGTNLLLFKNGVLVGTLAIGSVSLNTGSMIPVTIGSVVNSTGAEVGLGWNGHIDELRITKGKARYTAGFTTPTKPFADRAQADADYSKVVELIHFNGIDGATVVNAMHSWTVSGNAQVDTANAKFGSSILFDGASDYITSAATSADFQVFTGDFTVEFWAYFASSAGNQCMVEFGTGQTNRLNLSLVGNIDVFSQSGASGSQIISGTAPANNTWHHIAFVGKSGTLSLFVDGVLIGSAAAPTVPTGNLSCCIGSNRGLGSTSDFAGAIDEFRITKGKARYTANFTPPTAAFPDR